MTSRTAALIVCATQLLVAGAVGRPLDAQTPERKPAGTSSDRNMSLKAGWQLLSYDGCRFAVPGSWRADADGSLAVAPDGSNIAVRTFTVTNWSAHKAHILAAFGGVRVMHEDSEHRLWFEIGDSTRAQHYVDVRDGLGVCAALLEIRAATTPNADDTTRRIAESIGPAPTKWTPGAVR